MALRAGRMVSLTSRIIRSSMGFEPDDFQRQAELIGVSSKAFCDIHGIRVEARGSMPPGPKVIIMNHLGYIDPMMLGGVTPYLPIAKSEVAGWPLVGSLGRSTGVLFIVRGDAYSGFRVLRRAQRALLAGVPVLNFAEGTTSFGDDLLPFHRGLFGVARHVQAPVVPVNLVFEDRDLAWVGDDPFVPHYLWFMQRPWCSVRIEILEPIHPRGFSSAEDLSDATREAIRAARRPRLAA